MSRIEDEISIGDLPLSFVAPGHSECRYGGEASIGAQKAAEPPNFVIESNFSPSKCVIKQGQINKMLDDRLDEVASPVKRKGTGRERRGQGEVSG